ncbi:MULTISPECIES: LysR family transcriptional regulator [Pseudomonas]|uniref:LysR family transcriptional regulator n=1 Tax=Pseudomonas quercus TaxID=2722792 RepID=A0ABX0YEY6_9PSED|nr:MULTISPECIES: LysR family transcriptional regulator [Pseudomonas]MBF7143061.1 LysR family transcriptional regulator [Pseudomonas sp. LY10J]NJP01910.1 LysR family transcriptional regulator [Pseudomonas quercus]
MKCTTADMLSCIEAFVVSADLGSFARAAKHLNVSPSVISKKIAKLERILGITILDRSTRKLRVSTNGAQVLVLCQEMLRLNLSLFEVRDSLLVEPQGLIRILAPKLMQHLPIYKSLCTSLEKMPKLKIFIEFADRAPLPSDHFDIEIRLISQPPMDRVAKKWLDLNYGLYASQRYVSVNGEPTSPDDLIKHSCIQYGEDISQPIWKFSCEGNIFNIRPSIVCCTNEVTAAAAMTLQGAGITCLPQLIIPSIAPDLIEVMPEWNFSHSHPLAVWLLYPADRYNSANRRAAVEIVYNAVNHLNPHQMA